MQYSCFVVEVVLNRADSCPSLDFESYGKFNPSDPRMCSCDMVRHIVARTPLQLVCPFREWLPMLVWDIVFLIVFVLA